MPKGRLLGKITSKIKIYLHWTKPKIFIWIYWQTANEGRPRPEELIGTQSLTQKKNKWHTYTQIKQYKQKTCQTVRSY